MEHRAFWQAPSFTVAPSGAGSGYSVEITDRAGQVLATCDAGGTVRDQTGAELLVAPVTWQGRRDRGTDAAIEVADAEGRPLGQGRVVKYRMGPRARKATIAIVDAQGGEAARLEPRDKGGEQLAVTTDGTDVATVGVDVVKRGFLRKSRVYNVDFVGQVPDALRPLLVAATIRYDALLNAVVSASRRDDF